MAKKAKKAKKVVKPLTKIEQKRVDVLKDAIAQIRAESYNVMSGTGYVNQDNSSRLNGEIKALVQICELIEGKDASEVEFKKYFDKLITPKKPCQVCAKGALLLSGIRKFNNFTLEDALNDGLDDAAGNNGGTYAIFGKENADRMEAYFEGNDPCVYDEDGNCTQWNDNYSDDEEILIAIFQNAIANRGTFKP